MENRTWPTDCKCLIYILVFKKGDAKLCSNDRTIALISHSSKVILWVILPYMEQEMPGVQARFRKGRGTWDLIVYICWILKCSEEFWKKVSLCLIDYSKVFDCLGHENYRLFWKNWVGLSTWLSWCVTHIVDKKPLSDRMWRERIVSHRSQDWAFLQESNLWSKEPPPAWFKGDWEDFTLQASLLLLLKAELLSWCNSRLPGAWITCQALG